MYKIKIILFKFSIIFKKLIIKNIYQFSKKLLKHKNNKNLNFQLEKLLNF